MSMIKLGSMNGLATDDNDSVSNNRKFDDLTLERIEWFRNRAMQLPDAGIVISGMSGRFPKADSINEFEANLRQGVDMILDEDNLRWPCGKWDLPRRYGRLKSLEKFDYDFFGITRNQANKLDPQARVLYEVVYESILDAGLNPGQLRGTKTACFHGISFPIITTNSENILKHDISYEDDSSAKICKYFDLRGPSGNLDAVCSSSFYALRSAIQAILDDEADRAIVCCTNVPLSPVVSHWFKDIGSLSENGKIKFMDINADGYVRAEAIVSILIERKKISKRYYSSVIACENSIDGYKVEGFTHPCGKAQAELHKIVKDKSNVLTNHVQYIECHGTGTKGGDLEEINGLMSVYTDDESRFVGPLILGSVKTNMGHAESASGLCSLVKVNLMFEYELIYKSLHSTRIRAEFEKAVKSNHIKHSSETTRLEGKIIPICNYGLGGTNSSLIVKARDNTRSISHDDAIELQPNRLVVMFGRGKFQLDFFFDSILNGHDYATRNCLSDNFLSLVDCINSQKIDRLMTHRGFIVVNSQERAQLAKEIREYNPSHSINGHMQDTSGDRQVNIIIPGIGSDWPQMASGLQSYEPFWSTIKRLEGHLKAANMTDIDLNELLTSDKQLVSQTSKWVASTAYSIALINIVRDQLKLGGVKYFVGHSLGEIGCAYARGLTSERQTILLAYNTGKSFDDNIVLISGKTFICMLEDMKVELIIEEMKLTTVRVCCINGPSSTAVSGSQDEMEVLRLHFESKSIWYKVIFEDIGAHNFSIPTEELIRTFKSSNANILKVDNDNRTIGCWQENWLPLVECVDLNTIKSMSLADYVIDSMRTKINLTKAMDQFEENSIILELGASGLFGSQIDKSKKHDYVTLMQRSTPSDMQITQLLSSIGRLYCFGAKIDIYNFNKMSVSNIKRKFSSNQDFACQQIPSLSSLIKWKHDDDLFVMKYSEKQARKFVDLMLLRDLHPYLNDYKLDGRVVIPACAFIYIAWRYFSLTSMKNFEHDLAEVYGNDDEFKPIEFENVRFHQVVLIRPNSKLEIKYQQDLGRFEIVESGKIVCEGYMSSPKVKPEELLYETTTKFSSSSDIDASIQLNHDDIYDQLRIMGLDFGWNFKRVHSSSRNGELKLVDYNQHLICFLDSLLQSNLIGQEDFYNSMNQQMVVGMDYLRIQPNLIIKKLRNHNSKMKLEKPTWKEKVVDIELKNTDEEMLNRNEGHCLFKVHVSMQQNLVVTDGVEIRGLLMQNITNKPVEAEILSQQFVRDFDILAIDLEYGQLCDSTTHEWLINIGNLDSCFSGIVDLREIGDDLSSYNKYLFNYNDGNITCEDSKLVLRILRQFDNMNLNQIGELIDHNEVGLARQTLSERFWSQETLFRPLMEIVMENICSETKKLSMLELNRDYNCLINQVRKLVVKIDDQVKIEPSIVNPNIEFMESNGLIERLQDYDMKLSLFNTKTLNNLNNYHSSFNCIFYRDMSCSLVWSQQNGDLIESQLEDEIKLVSDIVDSKGYLFVLAKTKLKLHELVIYCLSQAYRELKINSKSSSEDLNRRFKSLLISKSSMLNSSINSIRCNKIESVANSQSLLCVAKKLDPNNGNVLYLFKKSFQDEYSFMKKACIKPSILTEGRLLFKINYKLHPRWLEQLKTNFYESEQSAAGAQQVWLCAIASKQSQNGGVIGLMKTLIKELGSLNVRCYYDMHTFKDKDDEKITMSDIKKCKRFQMALLRDQLWNCVDCDGNFGSYRHFDFGPKVNQIDLYNVRNQNPNDNVNAIIESEYRFANVGQVQKGNLSSFIWIQSNYRVDSCFKSGLAKQSKSFIRVHYSALNFKDIMLASGLLPDVGASHKTIIDARLITNTNLGIELSGVNLITGKRVMAICLSGSIATGIVLSKDMGLEIECPEWLSLEQAATIPVVYMVTLYGLLMRAKIKRGESVLIHAASGGVGQAALNICNHLGLTIYASVGSIEKRQFLMKEFGHCVDDSRIFSSRDCNFEHQIMSMTKGRGVDVVLNSLYGPQLQASLRCLAAGGRFVEIGKRDLFENSKLDLPELNDNKTIISVNVEELFYRDAISLEDVTDKLSQLILIGLQQGYVKPIKHKLFKINEIEDAFRFMLRAEHIGKVVIEINKFESNHSSYPKLEVAPKPYFSSSKSYIITGGLGGFGFEICKWLVLSQGVKNILITTRTEAKNSSLKKATIDFFKRKQSCNINIVTKSDIDTTTRRGCLKLCQIAIDMSPDCQIGGIFHLAMDPSDSFIKSLKQEEFDNSYRPKALIGCHLDTLTRELGLDLDYFVCFSSIASAFGNPGMPSYSYANSELERLCETRRRDGLHGLAIQWGPIGDVGIYYDKTHSNSAELQGFLPQRMSSCIETLSKLLTCDSPVYTSMVRATHDNLNGNEGIECGLQNRKSLFEMLLHVLGYKVAHSLDDNATLISLGVDSIMLVEIKRVIEQQTNKIYKVQDLRSITLGDVKKMSETCQNINIKNELNTHQAAKMNNININQLTAFDEVLENREQTIMKEISMEESLLQISNKRMLAIRLREIAVNSNIRLFVPKLHVPTGKFKLLNEMSSSNDASNRDLLFLFGPIYNDFSILEPICQLITNKLCVGINYTQEFSSHDDWTMQNCVHLLVSYLYEYYETQVFVNGHCDLNKNELTEVGIDLAGFSYGGVVAFEVAASLNELYLQTKQSSQSPNHNRMFILNPRKLIILDASPKAQEQVLYHMLDGAPAVQKLKQVFRATILFVLKHIYKNDINVNEKQFNMIKFHSKLVMCIDVGQVISFASNRLALYLAKHMTPSYYAELKVDEEQFANSKPNVRELTSMVTVCLRSYLHRMITLIDYECSKRINLDCLLLRTKSFFYSLHDKKIADDLNLSECIDGNIEIEYFSGDHMTFLMNDVKMIAQKIKVYLN